MPLEVRRHKRRKCRPQSSCNPWRMTWNARLDRYINGNVNELQFWGGNMLQLTSPRGLPLTTTHGTNWWGGWRANVSAAFWSSSCEFNWFLVIWLYSINCNRPVQQFHSPACRFLSYSSLWQAQGRDQFRGSKTARCPISESELNARYNIWKGNGVPVFRGKHNST